MSKYLAKYLNPKAISAIGGFVVNPKGLVEGNMAGAHKSPFHGFSVEFAGHREYLPGDDPKHIRLSLMAINSEQRLQQGLTLLRDLARSEVSSVIPF